MLNLILFFNEKSSIFIFHLLLEIKYSKKRLTSQVVIVDRKKEILLLHELPNTHHPTIQSNFARANSFYKKSLRRNMLSWGSIA